MKAFITKSLLFVFLFTIISEGICRLFIPKISHHKNYEKFVDLFPQVDDNTILIVGDSRVEWGVKPLLLNDLLLNGGSNYSSVNIAMPGSNGLDVISACLESEKRPKLILLGTSAFAPQWENFQFDSSKLTPVYSKLVNIKYFWRKHSYLWERNSIKEYLRSKPPFFLNHIYDPKGGVAVLENGSYKERLEFQYSYYQKKSETFLDSMFINYSQKLKTLKEQLSEKNIPLIVIRMPVVLKLQNLEKQLGGKSSRINFDYVDLDYIELYHADGEEVDSLIYQDGSHLSQLYAKKFTSKLHADIMGMMD